MGGGKNMGKKSIPSKLILFYMFMIIFSTSIVLASNVVSYAPSISLQHNILATVSEGTTIDTTAQSKLKFNLFESIDEIYYNGHLVNIENNSFEIDITGLHGKNTFIFNTNNEMAQFTYYLSNESGLLEDYELIKDKTLDAYITTHKKIRIIYTNKETDNLIDIINYLDILPDKLLENVEMIKMIPYENSSNIAGIAKNNTITLYKYSKYNVLTKQNILFHEIAHTFANKLINENILDYSYTEYAQKIALDNNQVSHYAKKFNEENGRASEDFAESIAFYFINPVFRKIHPNRAAYIEELLK